MIVWLYFSNKQWIMKKYLIIITLSSLIICIGFIYAFYSFNNLSEQTRSIEKDLSDYKKEQTENTNNFLALIKYNWKRYQNDRLGISFTYPEFNYVCEFPEEQSDDLTVIRIFGDKCDNKSDNTLIYISIEKNKSSFNTAKEAFFEKYLNKNTNLSLNKQLEYFKIDKFDAFGGEIIGKTDGSWVTLNNKYEAVIAKNDYLIDIKDDWYRNITDNKLTGNKPATDAVVSSIYFDMFNPIWK